jgi:hypothetical protein
MITPRAHSRIGFDWVNKTLQRAANIAAHSRSVLRSMLCIAISSIAFFLWHAVFSATAATVTLQSNQEPTAGNIKFKLTKIGDGRSDDGTRWTEYGVITSDGHMLYNRYFPFSTVDRANKQFRFYIKHAAKVIQRGPVLDDKGRAIAKRVLASFAGDEKGKTIYRLFWASEREFSEIEGEHLDDILALESRLKEKSLLEIVKESEPDATH